MKLLVARPEGVTHARFRDLPRQLRAGDIVVVNNSATVAGELDAVGERRGRVVLHAATPLDDGSWVVEVRTAPDAARAVLDAEPGERFTSGPVALTLSAALPARRVLAERPGQPSVAGGRRG